LELAHSLTEQRSHARGRFALGVKSAILKTHGVSTPQAAKRSNVVLFTPCVFILLLAMEAKNERG
jgi:hypothetical protein